MEDSELFLSLFQPLPENHPSLKGWQWTNAFEPKSFDNTNSLNIGVTGGVEFNFVSLIKFPLLSLTHEDVRLIGLNPQLNVSMYSKIDLKFHFVFWEIGLRTFLFGLTFSPLNFLALFDPKKPTQRYCYQASYSSNLAGPIVSKIVLGSTECTFGAIGFLTG